jgi:hypothetical protein
MLILTLKSWVVNSGYKNNEKKYLNNSDIKGTIFELKYREVIIIKGNINKLL